MSRIGYCLTIILLLFAILAVFVAPHAEAVIASNTTGNTTAPEDDFGFSNVGTKGGSTGIYLGYRWVLTAAHVGVADITLNGQVYEVEDNTNTRLENPTGLGLSQFTDLRLFRITEEPWLPTLKIADDYIDVWDEVIMIGNGLNRADTLIAWNVTSPYPDDENWTWTETDPPGDVQGYYMGSGQNLRWGTNQVEPGFYTVTLSQTNQFLGFKTDFDQFGGTEYEAQGANGDSGGGVFHKNGDQWELAGMINAVSEYPNQPSRALYGLETYCCDLSFYRDLILDVITPLPGDANLDDIVDGIDASIMAANWGRSDGVLWGNGDFNEDGVINDLDAAILAQGWNADMAINQGEAGSAPLVPEPSFFILIMAAVVGLSHQRVRR